MSGSTPPERRWVLQLAPADATTRDGGACPTPLLDDAAALLGEQPVCWAVTLGRRVARDILGDEPAFGGSPAAFELLSRGSEATALHALVALADPGAELPSVTEASRDGVRDFVRRNIPLDRVLHGMRVGHAGITTALLEACAALVEPEVLAEESRAVVAELFGYADRFADGMTRAYLAEYEEWSASTAAVRAGLVRSLLDAEPGGSGADGCDVAEATRALGYDLDRTHLGVVLWSDLPTADPELRAAARRILDGRGATAVLTIPVSAGRLWAWGAVGTAVPSDDRIEEAEQPVALGAVHGALGTPGAGIAGFRRSHLEALRAESHEARRRRAGCPLRLVTDYARVSVVALLGADLDAAGEFVRRELGPLAARDEWTGALRDTLRAWLEAERGLAAAAARLHVARGTVAYRVKRARQLLGTDLDEHRFTLTVALELAEELGDAVLSPAPSPPDR